VLDLVECGDMASGDERGVCVFAPAPLLTLTIERAADEREELHVHPGGQGYWVARMADLLGAAVDLCVPLGGETGEVLSHLLQDDEISLHDVPVAAPSGAYVHDRRTDQRHEWWRASLGPLGRHEIDELYTDTLAAALERGVCVLTGTHRQDSVLPDSIYTRLASDLRANGVSVLCDLRGSQLRAALHGRIDLVKISHEELVEDGWATRDEVAEIIEGMRRLHDAGARDVVVSRAKGGALALLDGVLLEARAPEMTAVEPSGAGDSMTAAIAYGRSRELESRELLRLGVAAGAVNVTRHGLGTGDADAIARLAANVDISDVRTERA
jgi:1-phosphofructokinase